jgi:hypothetical protein
MKANKAQEEANNELVLAIQANVNIPLFTSQATAQAIMMIKGEVLGHIHATGGTSSKSSPDAFALTTIHFTAGYDMPQTTSLAGYGDPSHHFML